MIFVRRDVSIIPEAKLKVAERAQQQLEALPPEQRKDFIKKKSYVWRNFSRYLAQMSYGKCWYSESPDPQSFFDVDHFRPKLEAKRSDEETDTPGYEWLAFSWENFRYAANCSNRVSKDIETGVVQGKGSWFPLLNEGKATWDDRCIDDERPLLLDPVCERDVRLIDIDGVGKAVPSKYAVGSNKRRVLKSCEYYGLNLERLVGARKRVIREVTSLVEALSENLEAANDSEATDKVADKISVVNLCDQIKTKTRSDSPYARTARATLARLGCSDLCAQNEDTNSSDAA